MRYQLLLSADLDGQPGSDERIAPAAAEPLADGAAGAVGLQWLWGLVELRLGEPGPDFAA